MDRSILTSLAASPNNPVLGREQGHNQYDRLYLKDW